MVSRTSEVAVCCSSDSLRSSVLTQLLEQSGILDGDHGLIGEVLHQLDLLVCERPDFLAEDGNRSDQLAFLEHRHHDKRPGAAEFAQLHDRPETRHIVWFLRDIRDVNELPGQG